MTHPLEFPNTRGSAAYREYLAWQDAESFEAVGAIWTVPEILGGDAPVLRVNQADTPLPFAPNLIEESLPTVPKVVRAAKEVMYLVK